MGSITISFGIEQLGDGSAVQLPDGSLLPREFTAKGTLAIDEGIEVELKIRVDDSGKPTCRAMSITSIDPDSVVNATLVKSIPVGRLIPEATAAAKAQAKSRDVFVATNTNSGIDYSALVDESKSPRKNSRMTPERAEELRRVLAEAEAAGDPAAKAVMDAFFVSRTTAWRWIKAVKAG